MPGLRGPTLWLVCATAQVRAVGEGHGAAMGSLGPLSWETERFRRALPAEQEPATLAIPSFTHLPSFPQP